MKWVLITIILTFLAFFLPLQYVFGQPDASAVDRMREQEKNLWSKVEYSLLSTQNEIDGLQTLVNNLRTDSQKLTSELVIYRTDYSKLQQLLKNTDNSYSILLINYNNLKLRTQRLITCLAIIIAILALLVINWIVDLLFWVQRKKLLWWG